MLSWANCLSFRVSSAKFQGLDDDALAAIRRNATSVKLALRRHDWRACGTVSRAQFSSVLTAHSIILEPAELSRLCESWKSKGTVEPDDASTRRCSARCSHRFPTKPGSRRWPLAVGWGVGSNRHMPPCLSTVATILTIIRVPADGKGGVAYVEFMKAVTLGKTRNSSAGGARSLSGTHRGTKLLDTARKELLQRTNKAESTTACDLTPNSQPSLAALRPALVPVWKDVRRDCKKTDRVRSGLVDTAKFRGILKKNGVQMSNEQFYHVLSHLDADVSHKVSYDDFFREALRA